LYLLEELSPCNSASSSTLQIIAVTVQIIAVTVQIIANSCYYLHKKAICLGNGWWLILKLFHSAIDP